MRFAFAAPRSSDLTKGRRSSCCTPVFLCVPAILDSFMSGLLTFSSIYHQFVLASGVQAAKNKVEAIWAPENPHPLSDRSLSMRPSRMAQEFFIEQGPSRNQPS